MNLKSLKQRIASTKQLLLDVLSNLAYVAA